LKIVTGPLNSEPTFEAVASNLSPTFESKSKNGVEPVVDHKKASPKAQEVDHFMPRTEEITDFTDFKPATKFKSGSKKKTGSTVALSTAPNSAPNAKGNNFSPAGKNQVGKGNNEKTSAPPTLASSKTISGSASKSGDNKGNGKAPNAASQSIPIPNTVLDTKESFDSKKKTQSRPRPFEKPSGSVEQAWNLSASTATLKANQALLSKPSKAVSGTVVDLPKDCDSKVSSENKSPIASPVATEEIEKTKEAEETEETKKSLVSLAISTESASLDFCPNSNIGKSPLPTAPNKNGMILTPPGLSLSSSKPKEGIASFDPVIKSSQYGAIGTTPPLSTMIGKDFGTSQLPPSFGSDGFFGDFDFNFDFSPFRQKPKTSPEKTIDSIFPSSNSAGLNNPSVEEPVDGLAALLGSSSKQGGNLFDWWSDYSKTPGSFSLFPPCNLGLETPEDGAFWGKTFGDLPSSSSTQEKDVPVSFDFMEQVQGNDSKAYEQMPSSLFPPTHNQSVSVSASASTITSQSTKSSPDTNASLGSDSVELQATDSGSKGPRIVFSKHAKNQPAGSNVDGDLFDQIGRQEAKIRARVLKANSQPCPSQKATVQLPFQNPHGNRRSPSYQNPSEYQSSRVPPFASNGFDNPSSSNGPSMPFAGYPYQLPMQMAPIFYGPQSSQQSYLGYPQLQQQQVYPQQQPHPSQYYPPNPQMVYYPQNGGQQPSWTQPMPYPVGAQPNGIMMPHSSNQSQSGGQGQSYSSYRK
jgi:hypothetical protein